MSNLVTKKFKILGMHCTSCAMNIDFDLEDIQGVSKANTNYARQECEVSYDKKIVTESQIIKQIDKTGYKAQASEDK